MSSKSKKEYCCDFGNCENKYRTKYSLKRHYLSHMGVKQHKCPHCEKRFSLFQYLQEHMYIHTGEKPFVCPCAGCGKRFRQAGKLSIHKKQHTSLNAPESVSQGSTKLGDSSPELKAIREVSAQLAAFQLPSFFFSKTLPLPPQLVPSM